MQTAKLPAFVFGLALVTSACGDSMSSLNPTAPSSLSPGGSNVLAGAEVTSGSMGNGPKPGNGNGNGNGNGQAPSTNKGPVEARVQFEGILEAVGDGTITIKGQSIKVTPETVIRHGDLRYGLSALQRGDRVHVSATRTDANGVVSLVAAEIKLQNPAEEVSGEEPPPPPPTGSVSIVALDANAVEGAADKAVFRLTRSGDASLLTSPLTVSFDLTGSAVSGADYSLTAATFAANVATVDVELSAVADGSAEGPETVVLTLTGAAPYTVGSPASATVNIADPPAPAGPTVSVAAQASTIHNGMDFVFGVFVLTRTGDLSAPLTVNYAVSGSAAGAYGPELGVSLTFPANDAEETVFFMAYPGTANGTVTVTVLDGAAYNPGSSPSATITVSP
jgi:hypothetical protein